MKFVPYVFFLLLFTACKKEAVVQQHQIQYFVNTHDPGYIEVWYADKDENVQPHQFVSPWGFGFVTDENPFTAVVAAIVNNSSTQNLTLTIKVDGKIVAQKTVTADSTQGALYTDMQYMYLR